MKLSEQANKDKLWDFCKKFIDYECIYGSESVYQSDGVILNAPEFIEKICNIVGYHKWTEEDDK